MSEHESESGEAVRCSAVLGIRNIAHTYCMDYPMPPGTRLRDMTVDDCIQAIEWKLKKEHDIIMAACRWIGAETKPPTGKKVLVCGHYSNGNSWRAVAKWHPAGTLDATMWDVPPDEWWDESGDICLCPHDGWWEESIEIEEMSEMENVTHWMALPEMPNSDLSHRASTANNPTP